MIYFSFVIKNCLPENPLSQIPTQDCSVSLTYDLKHTPRDAEYLDFLKPLIDEITQSPHVKEITLYFNYFTGDVLYNFPLINSYIRQKLAENPVVADLEDKLKKATFYINVNDREVIERKLQDTVLGTYLVSPSSEDGWYRLSFRQPTQQLNLLLIGNICHCKFKIEDGRIIYSNPTIGYQESFKNWRNLINFIARNQGLARLSPGTCYQMGEDKLTQMHKALFGTDAYVTKHVAFAQQYTDPYEIFRNMSDNCLLAIPSTSNPHAITLCIKSRNINKSSKEFRARYIPLPSGKYLQCGNNSTLYKSDGSINFSALPPQLLADSPDSLNAKDSEDTLCGITSKTVNFNCVYSHEPMSKPMILECCEKRIDAESLRTYLQQPLAEYSSATNEMKCMCCKQSTRVPTKIDSQLQKETVAWLMQNLDEAQLNQRDVVGIDSIKNFIVRSTGMNLEQLKPYNSEILGFNDYI